MISEIIRTILNSFTITVYAGVAMDKLKTIGDST